jgi:hypothetical protein
MSDNNAMTGHHAEHSGLQKHSVGGIYPLAVVGYANGHTTVWVVEHLGTGCVLCCKFVSGVPVPYQSDDYDVIASAAALPFSSLTDVWVKGRPTFSDYHHDPFLIMQS